MASVGNLEKIGAVGQFKPIATRRFFTGLFTNRSPLNEPGDGSSTRYYEAIAGAKSDALIDGLNMEVSNRNTLVTRPGFSPFYTAFPAPVLQVYSAVSPSGTSVLYDGISHVYNGTTAIYTKPVAGYHTRFITIGNNTFIGVLGEPTAKVWDGTSASVDTLGLGSSGVAPSLTLNAGSGMTASSGWQYVFCYSSSKYGHVSTASPVSASTGPGTWASITVSGPGTSNTAVDHVQIYRTADGGATFMFAGQVANVLSGSWSFTDTIQDAVLNPFILAPQNGANNPPVSMIAGSSGWAYFAGRLWAASANTLYFSAGPDCTNGNGLMAWPPTYFFQFPDTIQRLVVYSNGLLVFTTKDIYAILGTSTTTFYPKLQQSGLGINQYHCVDTKGSEIYVFTNRKQFIMISPASGVVDVGFPIGDKLVNYNPAVTFVACYTNGEDDAVYICDATQQIAYRMNPHQYPEGNICWSPKMSPATGCGFMVSIYDASNNPILLIADSSGVNVLKRDPSVSTDNGTMFEAKSVIGPVSLALPGDLALIGSITVESASVGNRPAVSVLTNEISGTSTVLSTYVPDPPELPAFSSYHSDRYYINQSETGLCRQVQLTIDYPAEAATHEVYGFSIYGELRKHD